MSYLFQFYVSQDTRTSLRQQMADIFIPIDLSILERQILSLIVSLFT